MIEVVTRAQWGARYADGFGAAPLPASEVWLHHSVTIAPDLVPPYDDEVRAMRTLEDIGQSRFGGGISYTFGAMPTGKLYAGHSVNRMGAHTGGRNSIARAIVLVGNADTTAVTRSQVESIATLLVDGQRAGYWRTARLNGGHQQAPGASTACPGRYGMAAVAAINERAAQIAAGGTPAPTPQEDDDVFLMRNGKGTVVLVGPGFSEWVPTSTEHRALLAKYPQFQMGDDLFGRIHAAARASLGSYHFLAAIMKDLADEEPAKLAAVAQRLSVDSVRADLEREALELPPTEGGDDDGGDPLVYAGPDAEVEVPDDPSRSS